MLAVEVRDTILELGLLDVGWRRAEAEHALRDALRGEALQPGLRLPLERLAGYLGGVLAAADGHRMRLVAEDMLQRLPELLVDRRVLVPDVVAVVIPVVQQFLE